MSTPLSSPPDALASLLCCAQPLPPERLPLPPHRVLAADITSPIDHPSFDQSAVDGYALRFYSPEPESESEKQREPKSESENQQENKNQNPALPLAPCPLPLTEPSPTPNPQPLTPTESQIRAGDSPAPLPPHACVRIFTGAPLPPGADTVVMQEHTRLEDGQLHILDPRLVRHANVRFRGEQIRAGAIALHAGQRLDAAAIGYLATLGITEVEVHRQPSVAILVTGNEFAARHEDLQHGRIYESNGQMLQTALQGLASHTEVIMVPEDLAAMQAAIAATAPRFDLLIATGGVSVGDHDHTRPAFEAEGYSTLIHGIAQKPGKPMYAAIRDGKVAFGLPGNPRAVLVCFYVYVWPYLQACMGQENPGLTRLTLPLMRDWRRKADGKTHFVTCRFREGGCEIIDDRASHMLRSFVGADGLVILPPDPAEFPAGTMVEVLLLPR